MPLRAYGTEAIKVQTSLKAKTNTLDSSPERYHDSYRARSTARGKKRTDLSSNSTAATMLNAGKKGIGYFSKVEIN